MEPTGIPLFLYFNSIFPQSNVMRVSSAPFFLVALIGILTACNPDVVQLQRTNADGEVRQLQNFSFQFDRKMVPDSLTGNWDSTQYIRFEPELKGRFRWQQPDELIFSPAQPLAPSTTYKAVLQHNLLAYSNAKRLDKADIQFFTPELRLEGSTVTWIAGASNTPVPQLELNFNYPVDPEHITPLLRVSSNDIPITLSPITISAGPNLTYRLNGFNASDTDMEAVILLDKGALPQGGRNGTSKPEELAAIIPSPFNLMINDIIAHHDGSGGLLQVKTSQQVLPENLAAGITISPAVKFAVEPTDDGFNISSSSFDADQAYSIRFAKGLRGRLGGVLREESGHQVAFGELYPSVQFDNPKAVYLSSAGSRKIAVNIINTPRVKVVVSRIYESNILSAMHHGYYPDERMDDYYAEDAYASYTPGDIIYEKEIDTRSLPGSGQNRIFTFNMDDHLSEARGIYHIRIRSATDYWISDSRFISSTDLGIIAREGKDAMLVFVNSIQSATPVHEARVIAYGKNNQVLGTGTTDGSGTAEISYDRPEYAGFKPAMVIVKTATDFNYLPFRDTRVNTSRFEVGGKKINPAGLEAFIYAPRDIFRPGEIIPFSVILRNQRWESPGQLPVKLRFLYPDGKEMRQFRKTLNEQGSMESSIDISGHSITGTYTLEVYSSTDVLLGTKLFNIEEFVPDRLSLQVKLNKQEFRPGEAVQLDLSARNFFGPPAANRNYETELQIRPLAFTAKNYPDYSFALANGGMAFDKILRQGRTDDGGKAVEKFDIPEMYRNSGLLQALFYTTVFDETGRPVSRRELASWFTQEVFLGLKDDGYNYFPLARKIQFPVIALNKEGRAVTANAKVKVIKKEYRTVLSKSGGYFRYDSQREDKIISEQDLSVSGENTQFSFTPHSPGNYELRLYLPGAASYTLREFYSYGHWGGDNHSFAVNTEGHIDISTDKNSYETGEKARVLFKTPFSGKLLVTLETDKVLSHQYIEVNGRTASMELNVEEQHLPNVYITATLIKPHRLSDIPLTVAYGFQRIIVGQQSRRNRVTISAVEKSRSNTTHQVRVKAEPGSYVTLAAVDNGVLQVSDFKTPDPFEFFYAARALGVEGYTIYPLLFPEIRSSTGGDGAADMQKRVNPMPAKRIKILSYWSGITRTNNSGEATFSVNIPAFSGELRLMAVAYKDKRFGSASKNMTVADPLVMSPALPRFLAPGDSAAYSVMLTNTTGSVMSAKLSVTTSSGARITGNSVRDIRIQPNAEHREQFGLLAGNAVGVEKITTRLTAGNETFTDITEMSIRPASPLQKRSGSGSIQGGSSVKIDLPVNDFLDGTTQYRLSVGRNPVLDLAGLYRFLVQYPYGCTEQVISAAFPQLYYPELTAASGSTAHAQNIAEAIRRIKVRQVYNGGILLWEGSSAAHWWTSVYAAHFLIEAAKAGYDVEEKLLSGLYGYISSRLKNRETINYRYNRDQQKRIAPREVAYSLYVLALASRPDIPVMNYYKAKPESLSLDSRYLLSAAYALAGDRKRFADLLPDAFSGEESMTQTGGNFHSPIRDEAIALVTLLEVDPGNAQIPVMARHVGNKLKARSWYSTQEASFSFLALGKIARQASASTATAEIFVNGRRVASAGETLRSLNEQALGGHNIEIRATGSGPLYYFWEAEGISESGMYKETDNYISVRRKFFSRNGQAINGLNFNQNDLVIVQVTVDKKYDGPVENLLITDILPAGFELENPRTREIPGMDWIKNASTPVALDVRDDRINLFDDLTAARQVYYYAVRAVSPGTYKMGPVSADALYNGEIHSYHGAGTITIR